MKQLEKKQRKVWGNGVLKRWNSLIKKPTNFIWISTLMFASTYGAAST